MATLTIRDLDEPIQACFTPPAGVKLELPAPWPLAPGASHATGDVADVADSGLALIHPWIVG